VFIPSERRADAESIIAQVTKGASFAQYETIRLGKNGAPVDVELTVSPLCDCNGAIVGGATICRDIRERKRVENSLARTVRELGTLFHLTERLQAAKSIDEIYEAALEAITSTLECERASILLFDAASVMRFVAWKGLTAEYVAQSTAIHLGRPTLQIQRQYSFRTSAARTNPRRLSKSSRRKASAGWHSSRLS
jgi:hypothetical protein